MIYTDKSLALIKLRAEGKDIVVYKQGVPIVCCLLVDTDRRIAYHYTQTAVGMNRSFDATLRLNAIECVEYDDLRIVDMNS